MRGITHESHITYGFRRRDQAEAFAADVLASGLPEQEPAMTVEVEALEPGTVLADVVFKGEDFDWEGTQMSLSEIEDTYLAEIARRHQGEWYGH